jgi:hypothetical protein
MLFLESRAGDEGQSKWLEALKQTAPHVTRVALVFNPHCPSSEILGQEGPNLRESLAHSV